MAKKTHAQALQPINQNWFVEAWCAVNERRNVIAVGQHFGGGAAESAFIDIEQRPAAKVHKERPQHQ